MDIKSTDLRFGDRVCSHMRVEHRDLEDAPRDEAVDGIEAGLSIGGAEGFVAAADDGDDDVEAFRLGQQELDEPRFDERHVAGEMRLRG